MGISNRLRMNSPKRLSLISNPIRSALLVLVLASVSGVAVGLYLAPTQSTGQPSLAISHFRGGIVVTFENNVPAARIEEVAGSVGGAIVLRDPTLNRATLRFSPAITLDQAWTIVRQLEDMPGVKSATPQFLDLGP
jgi:hypothetical protein